MASSGQKVAPLENVKLIEAAKPVIADLVIEAVQSEFGVDVSDMKNEIISKIARPKDIEHGEWCLPCFVFSKKLPKGTNPAAAASKLGEYISKKINGNASSSLERVESVAAYVNFKLSRAYLAKVLNYILDGSFLARRPSEGKERVMIEYSQPNTHKAFHVGHMRNAALGDSLVRLYEYVGYNVVGVNYFGDEGAHIAKCLWFLQRQAEQKGIGVDDLLASIPEAERGEWLGQMYSSAVEALELDTLTKYPYPCVIAAKVLKKEKHPAADAPANWNLVTLLINEQPETTVQVVCGGTDYQEGDLVAYLPVGAKLKGTLVQPKDMKGILSHGVILAKRELGIEEEAPKKEEKKEEAKEGKKGNKKKEAAQQNNTIYVLPKDIPVGVELTEYGRTVPESVVPRSVKVVDEIAKRNQAVRDTLLKMENGDEKTVALWQKTRQWSLDEFKRIYAWLKCRFDHDFFESEVGESSRQLVLKYFNEGKVFIKSEGCIGVDLSAYNLGFLMVLKSDGSGLYATKDLALAQKKFDEFKIDKSLYIVDAAQSLHFAQVFKCLELMGYQQAKQCKHLPYGLVVLPDGKMSSRKGTVILFSQLKEQLRKQIYEDFLSKYETDEKLKGLMTKEELEEANRVISVATIRYGMLNHDTNKDIVFSLSEWMAKSGNTGPYMLYAFARVQSIIREVDKEKKLESVDLSTIDYTALDNSTERAILNQLHEFWPTVEFCIKENNPSPLCTYLFELSKLFSLWYQTRHVAKCPDPKFQQTLLLFIKAISLVLQRGLYLLGIETIDRM